MIPIGNPQFGFAVVGLQGFVEGDGAAPEGEAVVVAHGEVGGGEVLFVGDVLGDGREDVLVVEASGVEGFAEGAGEMIAGGGQHDAAGDGGAVDAVEEGAVLNEFQLGGRLVEIAGGHVLPDCT